MKIAAICGAPNNNTGMMFVDRSLYYYLKHKNLLDNTTFFCFQHNGMNSVGFEYKALTNDINLKDYDLIFIWGDFIVSRHFLKMTQPRIEQRFDKLKYDLMDKVLMTDFSIDELKKVIVFGQCLFVDGIEVFSDTKYLNSVKRLIENANLFKVRDPLSAHRIKLIIEEKKNRDFLGVDSALLNCVIDDSNIRTIKENINTNGNTIGLYFGRSKKMNNKKRFLGFYLNYKFKSITFNWIPWLRNKQSSKKYFQFAQETNPNSHIEYIEELLKCKLIITDTYHISLMAWSLGIPCICYGNSAERFKSTVHDKKKEIFFISNAIDDYYFTNERFFRDLKNNLLYETIDKALKSNIGDVTAKNIINSSKVALKDLNDSVNSILHIE